MDGGVSKRKYRRVFGLDEEDSKMPGRRQISEGDSYKKVYDYVEQLHESAQNARLEESFEKRLFGELKRFKESLSNGKTMLRVLENLISQRAYEKRVSFMEFFEELREKRSLYDYFDCLTDGGKLGYGERLKELRSEEEMRARRDFRSGAGKGVGRGEKYA